MENMNYWILACIVPCICIIAGLIIWSIVMLIIAQIVKLNMLAIYWIEKKTHCWVINNRIKEWLNITRVDMEMAARHTLKAIFNVKGD